MLPAAYRSGGANGAIRFAVGAYLFGAILVASPKAASVRSILVTIATAEAVLGQDIRRAHRRVVDDLTEVKGAPAQQKQGDPSSAPFTPRSA